MTLIDCSTDVEQDLNNGVCCRVTRKKAVLLVVSPHLVSELQDALDKNALESLAQVGRQRDRSIVALQLGVIYLGDGRQVGISPLLR